MRKDKRISSKIWKMMAASMVVFVVVISLLNLTIIHSIRNDIIFDELESILDGEIHDDKVFKGDFGEIKDDKMIRASHFAIDLRGSEAKVYIDPIIREIIDIKFDRNVVALLVDEILGQDEIEAKGILETRSAQYYYVTKVSPSEDIILVYFSHISKPNKEIFMYIGSVLLLGLLSFIPSSLVARQISKPILALEDYAEEISNRHWEAKSPESDILEINQLSDTMRKMKKDLQIAHERDQQFLQKTSHDLKTPVMIIKGYAQAMIDDVIIEGEKLPEEVILSETDRLERKIKQLLQLNTIGHSLDISENYELIRIDRLIKSLISRFSVIRPELKWDVDLAEFELNCDTESVIVAVENVFDNQMRFAKEHVYVQMASKGDQLQLIIGNDGEHFRVKDTCILFDSYKKDMEGNFGLGLAIVKKVVEAHGGRVNAKNTETGVEFIFTMTGPENVV